MDQDKTGYQTSNTRAFQPAMAVPDEPLDSPSTSRSPENSSRTPTVSEIDWITKGSFDDGSGMSSEGQEEIKALLPYMGEEEKKISLGI